MSKTVTTATSQCLLKSLFVPLCRVLYVEQITENDDHVLQSRAGTGSRQHAVLCNFV
jgi:hypothetical protein